MRGATLRAALAWWSSLPRLYVRWSSLSRLGPPGTVSQGFDYSWRGIHKWSAELIRPARRISRLVLVGRERRPSFT